MNLADIRTQTDSRLQHLLDALADRLNAGYGCIYGTAIYASVDNQDLSPEVCHRLLHWVKSHTDDHNAQPFIDTLNLPDIDLQSVLVYPLTLHGEIIGSAVLCSKETAAFSLKSIVDIAPDIDIIQTIIENQHLSERLMTTETIAAAAQAIAKAPSPQNIVQILQDYVFDVNISGCLIFFFGPIDPENRQESYDYVEIVGSWLAQHGQQAGIGSRYSVDTLHPLMTRLQEKKTVILHDIRDLPIDNHDPFFRQLSQHAEGYSAAILLLESDERTLGMIAILAPHSYQFDSHDIRTYQIVTEFLTMSTLASALQRQANFVQQGRAALLDVVTDGVIMILPDDDSTVLTINDRFLSMFSITPPEIRLSLWQLIDRMSIGADARRMLARTWQQLVNDDHFVSEGEFQTTSPTGSTVDIQWYSAPVFQAGVIIGRIFTFHDITPERTSERLRSELLSRISHELRTPLTSIRGFAKFILETYDHHALPDLAREYVEIIHSSSLYLNTLFTDIIELTRANAGQITLNLGHTPISEVITRTVQRLTPQSQERQQSIQQSLSGELPPIALDMDRVEQVLTNLISNAIKYSPEDSLIQVTAQRINDRAALPPHAPDDVILPCILIGVVDTGDGLSPDDADRIFLPFYRTGAARRTQVEGAGLGLSISQSIVQLHRGRLWVEPATKKRPGGRFFFTLPID